MFGSEDLARELLPKLLDSYAVDYMILRGADHERDGQKDNLTAIQAFEAVCLAGSEAAKTPGAGWGIRTRQDDLLGDGIALNDMVVHYGVQVGTGNDSHVPRNARPTIIYPPQNPSTPQTQTRTQMPRKPQS